MIEVAQNAVAAMVEKFCRLERQLSQEHGSFVLFALFEREDAPGKWDVVISAEWASENQKELLNRVALEVRNFAWEEKVILARILILEPSDPFVKAINSMVNVEHARGTRFTECVVNGIPIRDSYIITSRHPGQPARQKKPTENKTK